MNQTNVRETADKHEVEDFIQNIKLAFKDLEIHRNYRIGNFFVDLFIPEYNIVIEFDEPYHMRQQKEDENRKKIVLDLIRENTYKEYATMLRFKSNCNIFEAIYEIREQIAFNIDVMHNTEILKLNAKYNRMQTGYLDLWTYEIQKAFNDMTDWVLVKTWNETNDYIDSQRIVKITHGERFGSRIDWENPLYSILVSEHDIGYGNKGIGYIGFGGIPFHFCEGNGIWARCEDHEHIIKVERLR